MGLLASSLMAKNAEATHMVAARVTMVMMRVREAR